MAEKLDTPDRRVAQLAARQHGIVSVAQLRHLGLSDDAVLGRVRAGRLHRMHRGVLAVGHLPTSFESRCMAAALACGGGAVVSRISAAGLWELLDPHEGPVHVSVPARHGRALRAGIRLHRCPSLTPEQVTRVRGIPATTTARTIADLRKDSSPAAIRRAIRQAEVLGLKTGLPASAPTRSELEDLFLALCRDHSIPAPRVNVRVAGLEVDFLWPEQRLVVETDGYRYHRGSSAFENDHDRDLRLRADGYNPLRLTYLQVRSKPARIAALLRRELAA